jgi:hypothetical protein
MKNINEIDGTETTLTRAEILALHAEMNANHKRGMDLLESIRSEIGLNQAGEAAAREEQKELAEDDRDAGLTTEINTSRDLVRLEDTIAGFVTVLARHPFGFKGDGTRDASGKLKGTFKPFTPEEDAAGERWLAGPKQGKEWAATRRLSTDCWTGDE